MQERPRFLHFLYLQEIYPGCRLSGSRRQNAGFAGKEAAMKQNADGLIALLQVLIVFLLIFRS